MREIEGVRVLDETNNDYNINVNFYIKLTSKTKDERKTIDILGQWKSEEEATKKDEEEIEYIIEESMNNREQEEEER